MKCSAALLFAGVALSMGVAPVLRAQEWARARVDASSRKHEWIQVKNGARTVETFVAYPDTKEKRPAVLVIHTIAGFIDWIESASDQLAEAGYIAVAPDLLS